MIRLLHVIAGLELGGVQMVLYRLLRHLDRSLFESRVVSLTETGVMGRNIRQLGVPVEALGMRPGVPDPRGLFRLACRFRRWRPNVIHTWMYHVCCSEPTLAWHRSTGYAAEKMLAIPNGVDVETFRPDDAARASVRRELGLPDDALLLGLVARWDPQKDHRTFVGAAALDVAALCSTNEGFGNVVAEAMACDVPCAVTRTGEPPRLVADTGRVVPPGNPSALAEALEELLAMPPEDRKALGRLARRRVKEHYNSRECFARYRALYLELASPRRCYI